MLRLSLQDRVSRNLKQELFGAQANLVPPLVLMHDGPPDYKKFKQNGDEYLEIMVVRCGLKPHHRVLDLGCGIGRKTLPLVAYLDSTGSYEGMDIVEAGIKWCQTKYTPRYPNFHFRLMDVWNGVYHPAGKTKSSEYRFPFQDGEFDFVILGSVFTHMLPEDMRNYTSEIGRLLKPRGKSLISYFLLNEESKGLISSARSTQKIVHEIAPGCQVADLEILEDAVGYDEDQILSLYAKCGLKASIYYGSWCGREKFLTYQDLVIGEKS